MGKRLVISGADFYENSIPTNFVHLNFIPGTESFTYIVKENGTDIEKQATVDNLESDITIKNNWSQIRLNTDTSESVKNIVINDSDKLIDSYFNSFNGCTNLKKAKVSGNGHVTTTQNMFIGCSSLEDFDLNIEKKYITNVANMFNGCSKLTSIKFTDIIDGTSPVINMNGFVCSCSNLTSVDALGVNTSNVTDLGYVFYGDTKLPTVNLYDWDVSNVQNMSHTFEYCHNIISINMMPWQTSSVTTFERMFFECYFLLELHLTGFDTSHATNMDYMFGSCHRLHTLYLGTNWNLTDVTSTVKVFNECCSLSTIDYPVNSNDPKVTALKTKLEECEGLYNGGVSTRTTITIQCLDTNIVGTVNTSTGRVSFP